MKRSLGILLPGGLLGILLALTYISPHSGSISLSQLVLQLSGSQGDFPLHAVLFELLNFVLLLLPSLLFESLAGISFYKYYCTASVYIFSRIPNRRKWYYKEAGHIALLAVFYHAVLLGSMILVTAAQFPIVYDTAGWLLLGCHFLLHTLWALTVTLLINLIAIFKGSTTAFLMTTVGQFLLIYVLRLLDIFQENEALVSAVLRFDPMSHLVLGWHCSASEVLDTAIAAPYQSIHLEVSLLIFSTVCLLTVLAGAAVTERCDLLVSDAETGGI